MLRITLFALIACIIVSEEALALQTDDIVYLKNGSVIRGVIVEQIPGETTTIRTRDGNVFVFNMSEIDRITREQVSEFNQFVGQRVRVTIGNNQVTGNISRLNSEGFDLDVTGAGIQRYEFDSVTRIERSAGLHSNTGKGYLIGAGIGTAAVVLTFADEDWGKGDWIGFVLLGQLVGGLPGAMAGRILKTESWEYLSVSQIKGMSFTPYMDLRYGREGVQRFVLGGQIRF